MFAQHLKEVKSAGSKATSVAGAQLPGITSLSICVCCEVPLFQQAFLVGVAVHGQDELMG